MLAPDERYAEQLHQPNPKCKTKYEKTKCNSIANYSEQSLLCENFGALMFEVRSGNWKALRDESQAADILSASEPQKLTTAKPFHPKRKKFILINIHKVI